MGFYDVIQKHILLAHTAADVYLLNTHDTESYINFVSD